VTSSPCHLKTQVATGSLVATTARLAGQGTVSGGVEHKSPEHVPRDVTRTRPASSGPTRESPSRHARRDRRRSDAHHVRQFAGSALFSPAPMISATFSTLPTEQLSNCMPEAASNSSIALSPEQ
jgi:hypothetical protein